MQMRARCQSRTANGTYYISLRDPHAFANALGETRQVGIQSLVSVGMPHNYDVSVAPFAPDEIYVTVGGDPYACPSGRAVVDPFMRAPCLEYRVKARICKSGSYAGELDWGTQKGPAHVATIRRVITVATLIVAKKHGTECMTLVYEFSRKYAEKKLVLGPE